MQRKQYEEKYVLIIHNKKSAALCRPGVLYNREHLTAQVDQSTILILTHRIDSHAYLVTGLTPWELG